jgi:hypothetical protein
MSDITKCTNDECPIKEKCYRWTATWGMRQSVCCFEPEEDGECEHFWDNEGRRKESNDD